MTGDAFDEDKATAFNRRVVELVNSASLTLMISIGHRTRLFDTMSGLAPSTSAQIAQAAGLDERYVREWLGAMTVGGIVDHDGGMLTYMLPPEHAASLVREAGLRNIGPMTQFIPLLGDVEDGIVECFRHGGGLPYDAYPKFQEVMQERSDGRFHALLLSAVLPLVEGLSERLSGGIDVADIGCGNGTAPCIMAQAFPQSRFTGYDFLEEAMATARARAGALGLSNLGFEARDAAALEGASRFDLITTFDAIHDQARPDLVLAGIARLLRDDGVYICADFAAQSSHAGNIGHPVGPFMYTVSTMHCMSVSLAYGGMGLGAAWGEQVALSMMADAGFGDVTVRRVRGDGINNYYIARKR